LRAEFGPVDLPRFDLVLLGVGEDGHTASLFPGTLAVTEQTRWVAPNWVPKLDSWRITLTMPVLCAGRRVWIFAVGGRKAAILRDVLGETHDPRAWPVQGVVPSDGSLVWWVDEAAAADLA
jgi:6-phosphogluconolactonase